MTTEDRLVAALHHADEMEPSPDLFARLERSIAEDRAFRRRRVLLVTILTLSGAAATAWVGINVERDLASRAVIDAWKLVIVFLAVAGGIIIRLAPHIRRFARSFVDDVFHLTPETGGRFLDVLDIAYYLIFGGLVLVDADLWSLGETVPLRSALEDYSSRLATLLLVMGVLHALNIALLPVLGLVYNASTRLALRRQAGLLAPPESMRSRSVDRHARSFAIGIAVLAGAAVLSLILSAPGIGGLLQ